MPLPTELDRLGIDGWLQRYAERPLLRLLTCGSVDDGKSTLIGRLLHDTAMLHDDTLAAAVRDSRRYGTTGGELDYALLVDGLEAERQQGITIDVAWRYFSTARRKFIIADTPGHEQYTRNMATGASTCDLAVILIDAQRGVTAQTQRHSFLVSLLGIRHVVVAVNKMDLVQWSAAAFEAIRERFLDFAGKLGFGSLQFVPVAARHGDNVVQRSGQAPWYQGPPLLDHLETVSVEGATNLIDFRLPVQLVLRPDANFRGYAGSIASGSVRPGDRLVAVPSGRESTVQSVLVHGRPVAEAWAPMAVVLTLADAIDLSRGDVLAKVDNVPVLQSRLEAMLVWMHEAPLAPGRSLLLKHACTTTAATVTALRYRTDVATLHRAPAARLQLNEIGRVELETARPLPVDPYRDNRAMGAFVLIDRQSNATVGAGMVVARRPAAAALARRRSAADAQSHVRPPAGSALAPAERRQLLDQQPFTLWLTGLPRAGKSALARELERQLFLQRKLAHALDGALLRAGLSADLGFAADDRWEHVRRAAEVARLYNDAGLIAIVALVSPSEVDRRQACRIVGDDRCLVLHCDAPLAACEARDDSGLYAGARSGDIAGVTGIDQPYEAPPQPFLRLDTVGRSAADNAALVLAALRARGLL